MYAQNIEGGSWKGEKIDKGKIDKMSGITLLILRNGELSSRGSVQTSSWVNFMSSCRPYTSKDMVKAKGHNTYAPCYFHKDL